MITVIARWDSAQIEPSLEYKMYRQLKGAFRIDRLIFVPVMPDVDKEQYDSVDSALAACSGQRVFLEPTGQKAVRDIPEGDVIIVVGNTQMHNLRIAQPEETYRIATPTTTDIYGVNAVAIALAVRHGN